MRLLTSFLDVLGAVLVVGGLAVLFGVAAGAVALGVALLAASRHLSGGE